ncbi:MAG: peptide deformylase [Thermosulfidibacteraceae bacterium]
MPVRDIIKFPDKRLRVVSKNVENIDGKVMEVVKDMLDTMSYYDHSVGISAIQIGEPYRIICFDASKSPHYKKKNNGLTVLINPVILERESEKVVREGCLSVPEYVGFVERSRRIVVKGFDLEGKEIFIEANHLEAVIIQHEIDHLDGILFIDRVVSKSHLIRRDLLKKDGEDGK